MSINTSKLRDKIKSKLAQSDEASKKQIYQALNISKEQEFTTMTDEQLETRVNQKLLGMLNMSMSDFEYKK